MTFTYYERMFVRPFTKALKAHQRALEKAIATEVELFAAERVLYDRGINISDAYAKAGVTRPQVLKLPLAMREHFTQERREP